MAMKFSIGNIGGFRGGAVVHPPKIFKDSGTRGYIYMYIMTNVHMSRLILKSQLFTCLSLAILFQHS